MKQLIPAALFALLISPAALATAPSGEHTGACTQDEANALAAQVAERISDIIDQDPQRAAAINNELQEMRLRRTADTLGDECEAYRARLAEIKRARRQADLPPADQNGGGAQGQGAVQGSGTPQAPAQGAPTGNR